MCSNREILYAGCQSLCKKKKMVYGAVSLLEVPRTETQNAQSCVTNLTVVGRPLSSVRLQPAQFTLSLRLTLHRKMVSSRGSQRSCNLANIFLFRSSWPFPKGSKNQTVEVFNQRKTKLQLDFAS